MHTLTCTYKCRYGVAAENGRKDGKAVVSKGKSEDPSATLMMLPSDLALVQDAKLRACVQDAKLRACVQILRQKPRVMVRRDFAGAFQKLEEVGTVRLGS